jgi:hypothetical protein
VEAERFQTRVLDQIENASDKTFMDRTYFASREKDGFREMPGGVRTHRINSVRVIGIYEAIGYTLEELAEDNAAAGYEYEINLDYFSAQTELILEGDTLAVNFPIDKFTSDNPRRLYQVDIMKYFGAGGPEDTGYLMVPSGSGALIDFNNGKSNEESYVSAVYGLDTLMNYTTPQLTAPVRLPVLGVKNGGGAVLAYADSGAGMAVVNADGAGRTSQYTNAWFSFTVRDYAMANVTAASSESDMTVVQPYGYEGDITVKYCFIPGAEAGYAEMAQAYQNVLINQGKLKPLAETAHSPFYLDIIGATETENAFILGVPYNALTPMTTYGQAHEIFRRAGGGGRRRRRADAADGLV